jgi:hypothetical protein
MKKVIDYLRAKGNFLERRNIPLAFQIL